MTSIILYLKIWPAHLSCDFLIKASTQSTCGMCYEHYDKKKEQVALDTEKELSYLFDFTHEPYLINPYHYYAKARECKPVYESPYCTFLFKQKDIKEVLLSKKIRKNYWLGLTSIYGSKCYEQPGFKLASKWMLYLNPPENKEVRHLFSTALGAKLPCFRALAKIVANDLIESFIDEREVDLCQAYARKLPFMAMSELLGAPKNDHLYLMEKMLSLPVLIEQKYLSSAEIKIVNDSARQVKSYMEQLCIKKHQNPDDSLISLLLKIRSQEKLDVSDDELVRNIILLYGAGYETSMNMIANGLLCLHNNLKQLDLLKKNESLIANAIIEILRFETPLQIACGNLVTEDLFLGSGIVIPKGKMIAAVLGSACRDPDEYDNPDQFLITRIPKPIPSFGYGTHFCIGSHLGKIQGEVAIMQLLNRIPTLQIKNIKAPKWRASNLFRSLIELAAYW